MNAVEPTTVIGKSVKILGDLSGSEDLVMEGEIDGTIQLPGARLTIGAAARVRADILAQEVIIFGRVEGDVRAAGRVELRASALVQGNIYAGNLSIEENAAFRGQVDPTRASEPLPVAAHEGSVEGVVPMRPSFSGQATGQSPFRSSTHLPAALAAVASRPKLAATGDLDESDSEPPLFAESKP